MDNRKSIIHGETTEHSVKTLFLPENKKKKRTSWNFHEYFI